MLTHRHLAAHRPVVELRLEHDHRIGIADRRREQTLRVRRRRRDRHLHPGRVRVVRLWRIVVQLRRANAAAVRHPHDQRELHPAARPPAVAADVRDQLVEARVREARRTASRTPAASPPCRDRPPCRGSRLRRAAYPRTGRRRTCRVGPPSHGRPHPRGRRPRPSPAPSRPAPSSTWKASLIASTSVSSAIEQLPQLRELGRERRRRRGVGMFEQQPDIGRRLGLRRRDPRAQRLDRLRARRLARARRSARRHAAGSLVAPEAFARLLLLDPLEIDVARGSSAVACGAARYDTASMKVGPSPSAPGATASRVASNTAKHIAAVDPDARNPVADRLVRQRLRRRLSRERRRDRPLVVVAEEDQRRAHDTRRSWRPRGTSPRKSRRRRSRRSRTPTRRAASSPREPGGVWHVGSDRNADRRDVVVEWIPPAGRMTAPPGEHRRDRHPAQEADRRLAVAGKDPVVALERIDRAGLHRLVIPEDRVRADPALAVEDDRTLVVRPQQRPSSGRARADRAPRAPRPLRPESPRRLRSRAGGLVILGRVTCRSSARKSTACGLVPSPGRAGERGPAARRRRQHPRPRARVHRLRSAQARPSEGDEHDCAPTARRAEPGGPPREELRLVRDRRLLERPVGELGRDEDSGGGKNRPPGAPEPSSTPTATTRRRCRRTSRRERVDSAPQGRRRVGATEPAAEREHQQFDPVGLERSVDQQPRGNREGRERQTLGASVRVRVPAGCAHPRESRSAACLPAIRRPGAPARSYSARRPSRKSFQRRNASSPDVPGGGSANGSGETSITTRSNPRARRSSSALTARSSSKGVSASTSAFAGSVPRGRTSISFQA